MKKRWWNERTRVLLTLELAVVVPAAALILFSLSNLRSIQRDKAVEAAIQRDFYQMLAIAEKRINEHAYKLIGEVREQLPGPDEAVAPKLDKILEERPYVAHVFLFGPDSGCIVRSQPKKIQEPYFGKEHEDLSRYIAKADAKEAFYRLRKMEEKEGESFFFYPIWVPRAGAATWKGSFSTAYQPVVYFTVPRMPQDRIAIAGFAFDREFLQREFFPDLLNKLLVHKLPKPQGHQNGSNEAVMMVRVRKESHPLAMSAGWNGGTPEAERNFENVFPGLTLAIKFRGTTIDALCESFLLHNYLTLGALSLVLGGGVFLTYRNVTKEMALAKLKSDFVSNVSHELRTPLSLIRLYAETLKLGRLSSENKRQEYYSIIESESERLTGLINNILDFSRIEAGKKEYNFRETNLAQLVHTTLESYRYQIEQHGFTFEQNIAHDLPTLRLDREAIARSLLNLVNNALKYSREQKYLKVNLYRDNGAVKLEVIDHGIGIPRCEQNKIFEKFYRVGDPLVHNTKGSGLGLPLVRHIVQAHGGQVLLESAPGQGSKFTIALPLDSGG